MKKYYEGPEIEIRNYILPPKDIIMTSDPSDNQDKDLDDDDTFDLDDDGSGTNSASYLG